MRPEVALVAVYSFALLGAAAGLHRLGASSRSAWRSRVLEANRRAVGPDDWPDPPEADWPHSEVPRLHTTIALVAAVAATLLPAAALLLLPVRADSLLAAGAVATGLAVTARLTRARSGSGVPPAS